MEYSTQRENKAKKGSKIEEEMEIEEKDENFTDNDRRDWAQYLAPSLNAMNISSDPHCDGCISEPEEDDFSEEDG